MPAGSRRSQPLLPLLAFTNRWALPCVRCDQCLSLIRADGSSAPTVVIVPTVCETVRRSPINIVGFRVDEAKMPKMKARKSMQDHDRRGEASNTAGREGFREVRFGGNARKARVEPTRGFSKPGIRESVPRRLYLMNGSFRGFW